MTYLLDTCVISEYIKKKPNPLVIEWLDNQAKDNLWLSILTIAELKKGIFKIRNNQPKRYQKLSQWLEFVKTKFDGHILPLNEEVLNTWAEITGESEACGKKLSVIDSLIGATAQQYNLIIVTRNINDFNFSSLPIFNPWGNENP
ncbi:VapC toxin protein (plasmid) [Geminocystis sp. NIES-3708]|uniref:type II toxin-antitoxin system VapC family toxin n=1 Tax=Geminocystis sp. NIES-3708 TaxID=1615909 RepID=UPI0005FCBC1C|nr:type II toxin-antitoxin system VapC family toxin [Geminocystis sp. NIES-3708]BAQ63188.1 VapC toxin protein [Geminocystis sp. NIES-3708]